MSETVAAPTETPAAPPPQADEVDAVIAAVTKAKPAEAKTEAAPPAEKPAEKAPEKPAEKAPTKPGLTSAQLQAFAREKEAVVKQQASLKAEKEALEKARAEVEAARKGVELARLNPLAYLEAQGWTQEKLAELVAAGGKVDPAKLAREEAERVKREILEEQRKEAEARKVEAEENKKKAQEEAEAGRKSWQSNILDFVNKNETNYPLTVLYGFQSDVPGLIEEHYRRTSRVMGEAEAARMVEEHLEGLLEKATKVPKVAAKFAVRAPEPAKSTGGDKPTVSAPQSAPKTLTNDLGANAASAQASMPGDDLERAMRAYEANRKK